MSPISPTPALLDNRAMKQPSPNQSISYYNSTQAVRRLHLVDADNLAGMAVCSEEDHQLIHEVRDSYIETIRPSPTDHVTVACTHRGAFETARAWEPAQVFWRSGKDGADIALISSVETQRLSERFDEVVIASGDGIFADLARDITDAGIPVTVAIGRGGLSRELARAATSVSRAFPTPVAEKSFDKAAA
jgi:uncharacterized LabA/DUF88 family protein